MTDRLRHAYIK